MEPKPGWKTSEFWITITTQLIAWLVALHFVKTSDRASLEQNMTEGIVAVFALLKSTYSIGSYIKSRGLAKGASAGILFLAVFCLPNLASAQTCGPAKALCRPCTGPCRMVQKTCLFGNCGRGQDNSQVIALLTQIVNQNAQLIALLQHQQPLPQALPQSQQPLLIVLGGPQQQIPLGGPPAQQIPLGGPPLQNVPLGGPPQQQIPLGGPPQQQLPLGGPPRQDIPLGTPQQQQIPLGKPPAATPPGATGYQRFTISETIYWRPAARQVGYGR